MGVDAGVVIVDRKGLDFLDLRQEFDVPLANSIDSDDQKRVHREQLHEPEVRNQADVRRSEGHDKGGEQ